MTESMSSLMRSGMISGKAAAGVRNATLSKTRSQKGRMTSMMPKSKDEGALGQKAQVDENHINDPAYQRDRIGGMPSKGGGVNASYVPGKKAIDQFPQKQSKTFPAGAGYGGRGPSKKTGNTRMKGKQPVHSGGPAGGNAGNKSYYGGPKGRDGT